MAENESEKLLDFFIEEVEKGTSSSSSSSSLIELDTAIAYAGGNTEEILGRIFSRMPKEKLLKLSVATKANPWGEKMASVAGEGGLRAEKFRAQVGKSLTALDPKSRYFVFTRSRFGDDFVRRVGDRSRVVQVRSV